MSESNMLAILREAVAIDEKLDADEVSPNGDDYNAVMAIVRAAIAEASVPVAVLRAVVEVSGGVAELTECPAGVDVDIIDHDNDEAEREDEIAALMGRAAP